MVSRCGIIGLGKIGMMYDLAIDKTKAVYTHCRSLSIHPNFEIAFAVDPLSSQREIFSQNYKKPVYVDLESASKEGNIDVAVIANNTSAHFETIKQLLNHFEPKVILCEKPLAYNISESFKIIDLCKKRNINLFVNYMRRADPAVIEIKNRIIFGAIKKDIKGVAWYSKGFLHNGSHFFNILEFWLGPLVDFNIINSGRSLDNGDAEPDVCVKFEKGEIVFIAAWEEVFSHYTIELLSSSGRLRYDSGGNFISWQKVINHPTLFQYKVLDNNPEIIVNEMDYYQSFVLDQLSFFLEGKSHTLCTGDEAMTTLINMDRILKRRK